MSSNIAIGIFAPRRWNLFTTVSMLKTLFKAAVVAEVGAACGGYYVFHSLNTSADTRRWYAANFPGVLNAFGTTLGNLGLELPQDLVDFQASQQAPAPGPATATAPVVEAKK